MATRFSIIVPIYKVEKYLPMCIESIKKQTFTDFEAILVVDGSPDNCLQICKDYTKDDGRFLIINKENGGLVSARKAGTRIAQGDYIVCLDGDDWISENHLETLDKVLNNQDVDVLCFGYNIAKGDIIKPTQVIERKGYYSKEDIESEIMPHLIESKQITSFLPNVWSKIYKREIYVQYQMKVNDQIGMGEDGACTIPIICNAKNMIIISDCLYNYRVNDTSMTRIKRELPWNGYWTIMQHFIDVLDVSNITIKEQLDRRIVHSFFTVAKSRFYNKTNYFMTKKEILTEMKKPIMMNAIRDASFGNSLKAIIIKATIKYKMIWLLYIISKVW